jgi:capsular exopolysaccharide synthesis family protein
MLGYPVLATLPELASGDGAATAAEQVISRPLSSFSEAIRGIQLGLTLSNVDRSPKAVVVTSALPGEGKTTTALALARHLAQTGQKVILVDGDLRRPNVTKLTGLAGASHDLIDALQGTCTLDQAISKDPISSLSLLPALKHVKNAPDLLESQAMSKIVSNLTAVFDFVIIDSAPILPVHDTKSLVRLADAVLFVVRWEKTPRDAAADAVKSLLEFNAPLAGVIMTRADVKRLHYYSFGYSGYYYAYSKYYEST